MTPPLGFTSHLHDDVETAIGDVGVCRYDGIELGADAVIDEPDTVETLLSEYDLDLYCVMGPWLESDGNVTRIVDAVPTMERLGARYLGLLPPRRGLVSDETFARWLDRIHAATDSIRPVIHHHGGTHVEQPAEIEEWLSRTPRTVGLLYDPPHYAPYGDEVEAVGRFVDDIDYVHFRDLKMTPAFSDHADRLTAGDFNIDSVIDYFEAFVDLGDGTLDLPAIYDALDASGYDHPITLEIENRYYDPLVHAKRNRDAFERLVE